ncbi:MAG: phosphoglycerate kinase [Oscillospiraceae bacterium]|jgi:phosphoglycerate kinase|nr:phosphoglycerate kinase [Oscillospiraceae bacterium]MBQ5489688.1 phosphoglycerate kinase [Oscillospiraceae bacterium]MBQ6214663.1 phosphoglycerate kinase [Oscillospiraceae bacterium]
MNYSKKTVYDADVKGKKVLVRCDFNVPQDKKTGEITSDKRIVAAIPTLKYLLEQGAAVIACSHLGKPAATFSSYVKKQVEKGKNAEDITEEEWKKSLKKLTLAPVAKRLSELLGTEVIFAADTVGEDAKAKASALKPGEIMLLENLRFDARETKNGEDFAKALADMADVYVSDAFGTVHRAHASTAGVAAFLPAYAGLLVEKEISIMGKALDDPKRPFVAVLGGAKVSDKINVINNLLEKADTVIIGGGMAYTFKKAQGYTIGKSLLEEDKLDYAKEMLAKAEAKGVNFLLPDDNFCASEFSADAEPVLVEGDIPDDLMGMDIGPKTVEKFAAAVKGAGTIVWNGPMGVFEFDRFANGTKAMAQALADSGAVTIVGGGDSAAAVEKLGFADRITHISTGGGASLEFLEGKELPGVACLLDK